MGQQVGRGRRAGGGAARARDSGLEANGLHLLTTRLLLQGIIELLQSRRSSSLGVIASKGRPQLQFGTRQFGVHLMKRLDPRGFQSI